MTTERAVLAGGCFWGMQDLIRRRPGVVSTRVGYTGGDVPNATYRNHGTHAEGIEIVYDPETISYDDLLKVFWENHDPTQGMRQGNDMGTQYRSAIYCFSPEQQKAAEALQLVYEDKLTEAGHGAITTEIKDQQTLYYAEDYHQQYLAKNPGGYCGHGGTGVSCPVSIHA